MADVALAFDSDNFTLVPSSQDPGVLLPTNVNNICDMTYQCDPPPVGPDIHANRSGYSLIADTLEAILP